MGLTVRQKTYLEKFGNRVSFDPTERLLYGHDIAAIPNMIRPLIGRTTPHAVVRPESEEELTDLVRWAYEQDIPLTPRGKASSGYGGVIPVKQGIVVDLYDLKEVLAVDRDGLTATVEPGITWEQLDRKLTADGLTLRLYPTSYPSSSVGGWLAQGGAGIGSYQYGYIRQNVVSARVVLPTGQVKEFTGDDLDLVADAEGITGFISQVTLRVHPSSKLDVMALACPDADDLQKLISSIVEADLPIWSLVFINPRMAELKNRAPLLEHHGHPVEERVILPAAYILTLAFRAQDADTVRSAMTELVKPCQAEILTERIAHHEWEHRFKLMVVKRLGPSLVPSEVIVPLSSLGVVMDEIEHKLNQPVVKEGVIIRKGPAGEPEAVILGFILSDQRRFSYNFVFGLVLTIMKIAEKHGGRPYATGMYFSRKADDILGKERAKRLRAFKAEVDPKGLMNPHKVVGDGLLGKALTIAGRLEPLLRPIGNHVTSQLGERPKEEVRDIPPDIAWYAYGCSQCGYCIDECDQFYGRGWESQSPRGKWYWLREYMEGRAEWNQKMVDTILACTTCELCNLRCSAALPIESSWLKLRGQLIEEDKRLTFPPFEMMAAALEAEGNIWAGYRKNRSDWFPDDLKEEHGTGRKSKNVYFAGCTASYVEKDIAIASVRLLDEAGVGFTFLGEKENCCATPMLVAGKWSLFKDVMLKNIRAVKETGADTVITSCPACDMMWRQIYPTWAEKEGMEYGITAKHYSEVISEKLRTGEFKFPAGQKTPTTVTWHDSCHIGRVSGVYEPPRELIKAVPNTTFVEMSHNRENAHCCGSVLTLLKEPEVAADVGKTRLDEAVEAGAKKVVALCPCCEFQLRVSAEARNVPVEVVDLAHFTTEAMGFEMPDPHPEVRAQWAVFEAMIALMTPRGFADLMATMFPELIDAMPFGMGRMMRAMRKIPGALAMMKRLFPVLFPRLLPGMMPKLMATILERVNERIPMPDYMAEQMPKMMPKVMNNLMPHMIGDVVPLVTQPMIDYLRGRDAHASTS
ncbi:MAG: Fe-S oxidoreductase [Latescibacteria bacterium DG_63]|nr:MAG: Fe-S oxidoreductase [Latescibacteria bacterium DG_63]